MKNLFRIPLLLMGLSTFFFSCEDDPDLGPPPIVGFDVTSKVAEPGELLTFTNNTTVESGTPTYEWNFGDGDLSAKENPTHFYSDTGNYLVTLKVTTEMGATEMTEQNIFIGIRYLKSIELLDWTDSTTKIDDNDSLYTALWDEDGSEPDIILLLAGPNEQELSTVDNPALDVSQKPFTLDIQGDFLLYNSSYFLLIGDEDIDPATDSVSYDWMIIRDGEFNPLVQANNPNNIVHINAAGQLAQGKNPETGEGALYFGNIPEYGDRAVGLMNFEIR
ncbi:MAG: PKD domain-containing protein [Flammeovirgaceae bacterium]|nr:PKD domain-containing protein [Flammeovirgaceae bacterium]